MTHQDAHQLSLAYKHFQLALHCSSDVWASGIMLLVSLCGAFPFDNGDQRTKDEENAIW